MSKENKRIVILGAGESGIGAALLAKAKGYAPFVSDKGNISPGNRSELLSRGIAVEQGQHTEKIILAADEIIKSPGIPDNIPLLLKIKEKNIPVISEIEFASRYTHAKMIAVTGTNGKSTTAYLTYHLMHEAGLNVCMAGNVGNSFAREVIRDDHDFYMLELSSFQLDNMYAFKADTAILLNITPDHLDRYNHDMDRYIASKFRITRNQTISDRFIYFLDDPIIRNYIELHDLPAVKIPVTLIAHIKSGVYHENNDLVFAALSNEGGQFRIPVTELPLKGPHNIINIMCAVTAASFTGVSRQQIVNGLKNFTNFPHRMETIASFNGITWINDSKATNVDAVRYALDSFTAPIIWICGGVDKGNNYNTIRNLVRRNVKAIICLGENNSKILQSFSKDVERIAETDNIKKAVKKAYQLADEGDIVLLSPACASFDLFKNYMDRGDRFREAVKELAGKNEIKI